MKELEIELNNASEFELAMQKKLNYIDFNEKRVDILKAQIIE